MALFLLAALALLGCRQREGPPLQRLIDQLPRAAQRQFAADIAGVVRPTLPSLSTEQRFVLEAPPARPALAFSVGITPGPAPLQARFEVLLEPASGEAEVLYDQTFDSFGWRDERIDLSARSLRGATLVFRRTITAASDERARAVWGNPMLLAAEPPARPSVVLVSLDTLRPDFVGAYGRAAARTPALDRLAGEGTLYEHAYSPSTWTLPSHLSLFFGRPIPALAGLRAPAQVLAAGEGGEQPLAVLLREAGYRTAGFTGGGFVSWRYGFARGFDTYYSYQHVQAPGCTPERFDGHSVFPRAADWLRRHGREPFFLFVHTYDVHDRCPFLDPDAEEMESWPALPPERRRALLTHYDDLIAATDGRLGALLAVLDELGRRDSTLFIVTSDHGEGFDEHGLRGHGCGMKPYEEIGRVPLIARWPGRVPAGERIATPVSLVDVAPSVLALLGLPSRPWMDGGLPGLGLADVAPPDRPVIVQCGDALAVRRGRDKLITSRAGRHADELYDLAVDPQERQPRPDGPAHAQLRADAAQFWQIMAAAEGTPAPAVELDAQTRERLRALGYLE